jgi:hypothetical protein
LKAKGGPTQCYTFVFRFDLLPFFNWYFITVLYILLQFCYCFMLFSSIVSTNHFSRICNNLILPARFCTYLLTYLRTCLPSLPSICLSILLSVYILEKIIWVGPKNLETSFLKKFLESTFAESILYYLLLGRFLWYVRGTKFQRVIVNTAAKTAEKKNGFWTDFYAIDSISNCMWTMPIMHSNVCPHVLQSVMYTMRSVQ